MDFIDNLVLPQSPEHMELLKDLLILTYILFIPYITLLLGSTILSYYYSGRGIKEENSSFISFAKDLIDLVTFTKSVAFGFAVIPLFSALFCYAQLLHENPVSLSPYISLTILFLFISLVFVYTFKHSFHLKDILSQVDENKIDSDVNHYKSSSVKLFNKSGKYAVLFLLITLYLFSASIELSFRVQTYTETPSIIDVLISFSAFTYFMYLVALSFGLTSLVVLFKYFRPNSETKVKSEEYSEFLRTKSLSLGIVSLLIIPFTVALNIITKPGTALTSGVFTLTIIAILGLLFLGNFLYVMLKYANTRYTTSSVFVFLIILCLLIVKDQLAFSSSTHKQYFVLASAFADYEQKMMEEMGGGAAVISGEDIFNGRCIACHKFEEKLVGPPNNSVLPKYEGKQEDLVKFILNPV
ncbi:MAG: hypothetical protein K9I99_05845, partial [Melioribacteraceae bacterium]|nr:hypothetical protein [Melioribacteraceae bacterium]